MIGRRIKEIRIAKELKQEELAKITGVSQGFISDVEKGKKMPGSGFVISLKRCFNINPDWLLTGEGGMFTISSDRGEIDPITQRILNMLKDMDAEDKIYILKHIEHIEREKSLTEIMKERRRKKADMTHHG